jgi:2-polyprenyl-3-methyl-5-hydroxy-6-metoxy-1,4-benzoquinol methylase
MKAPSTQISADARWRALMAPKTGNVYEEVLGEAAAFFGLSLDEARIRAATATERFAAEWVDKGIDPRNRDQVIDFYNASGVEVFDLVAWHAEDRIHHRIFHCAEIATAAGCRSLLDYGSGIGSDAIVFAHAGVDVTLADISEPLLGFARWRCEARGFRVKTIDLKREAPPAAAYDAVVCFDVLEHVTDPVAVVKTLERALAPMGYLFLHAPFGADPLRPMHIQHEDVVRPRLRAMGLTPEVHPFADYIWEPSVWRKTPTSGVWKLAYRAVDLWLPSRVSHVLRAGYRRLRAAAAPPRRRLA